MINRRREQDERRCLPAPPPLVAIYPFSTPATLRAAPRMREASTSSWISPRKSEQDGQEFSEGDAAQFRAYGAPVSPLLVGNRRSTGSFESSLAIAAPPARAPMAPARSCSSEGTTKSLLAGPFAISGRALRYK